VAEVGVERGRARLEGRVYNGRNWITLSKVVIMLSNSHQLVVFTITGINIKGDMFTSIV